MLDPDSYLKTIDRMEKEITPVDLTAGAASISISLRRIADQMEETNRLLSIVAKSLQEKRND